MYSLTLGVANATIVISCVIVFVVTTAPYTNFTILGPSPTIVVAGFVIDTWTRWSSVMVFAILSQISVCISVNTLDPYITNVVRDHKATRIVSDTQTYGIVLLKTSYDWILGILNTNLWVTFQVQFLVVGLLTDLVVTSIMTNRFLREKKRETLLPH